MISNLPDTMTIVVHRDEIDYIPAGSPSDEELHHALNVSQKGAIIFHRALCRPGNPQTKGDA